MNKETPSLLRVVVMIGFALTCAALLLLLWLAFGGSVALKPEGYRVRVAFPEATTLSAEADVRMAGVNIGKVKKLEIEQGSPRTVVELELQDEYAPIRTDTRAILRQKTLLGETYVELTPGSRFAPQLNENGLLAQSNVDETVELDEILRIFDNPTKRAFATWVKETRIATGGGADRELNQAIGNLPDFARDGADVLEVLHQQQDALTEWIRNTGVVFDSLNRRKGELADLIVNQSRFFSATQQRDDDLAETIKVFPGFLDETKRTVIRQQEFATDTRPLIQDLKPVADQLGPTVRDLGDLGPDLESFFKHLDPLIQESGRTLPQGSRFIRGLGPVLESAHAFLPELNPQLSYLNFQKQQLSDFISTPGFGTAGALPEKPGTDTGPRHYLPQFGFINNRSLEGGRRRPPNERGNGYLTPNALNRLRPLGTLESFDCRPNGGEQSDPEEGDPPCFVQPPSLFDGNQYPRLQRGQAPVKPAPYTGNEGTEDARP